MFKFPEPPTESSLADARRLLSTTQMSAKEVEAKIAEAEAALAKVVQESRRIIDELQTRRDTLEKTISHTVAYLSPIRWLPQEILRTIFMACFEGYPCIAWVLAAVCSQWRELVLRMPRLWSKIRFLTTQNVSADTLRLWLERSGSTVPLDIEIFLRVTSPNSRSESPRRRRRSRTRSPSPLAWSLPWPQQGLGSHYIVAHPPIAPVGLLAHIPPPPPPLVIPPSPPAASEAWGVVAPRPGDRPPAARPSRSSLHWGHIAIFYLAEQMHRWERFIFRFDRQFTSVGALKSINGEAPLLKEFEVSCAEAGYYPDWSWLPNAPSHAELVLPKLKALTLQYTPFKWSSPMLVKNLSSLNLRALPSTGLTLDRILYIVANNPCLESLTLNFSSVLPTVLPLSPTTLRRLKTLHIGGHAILLHLVDVLVLPALTELALDLEARDTVEDSICSLLVRSSDPPVVHLSIAYGLHIDTAYFYAPPLNLMLSWSAVLPDLPHLQSLHIGSTALEPLFVALSEEPWLCPDLEELRMKGCHMHSDGLGKLVSMVELRNPPDGALAQAPVKRLKSLELYDCAGIGEDVLEWLGSRVDEVVCTSDPEYDR